MKVLILGATGGIGSRVVKRLLASENTELTIRIICRSAKSVPEEVKDSPRTEVIENLILNMNSKDVETILKDVTHVISCLGHRIKQMFFPPYNLCQAAVQKLVDCAEKEGNRAPLKVIIINTVGVGHPDGSDKKVRSFMQNRVLGAIWVLIPPHRDNYRLSHYVYKKIKSGDSNTEWCVVRPDSLHNEDEESMTYDAYLNLQTGLFNPIKSARLTVAKFMADLVCNDELWGEMKDQFPAVYDKGEINADK